MRPLRILPLVILEFIAVALRDVVRLLVVLAVVTQGVLLASLVRYALSQHAQVPVDLWSREHESSINENTPMFAQDAKHLAEGTTQTKGHITQLQRTAPEFTNPEPRFLAAVTATIEQERLSASRPHLHHVITSWAALYLSERWAELLCSISLTVGQYFWSG